MLGYITSLTNWYQMLADPAVVTGGTRVYAESKPGDQYLVYAATGGSVTLNLPASSLTNYGVFRYDPRNGGSEVFLRSVGSGSQTFTVPAEIPDSTNDWVLRIKAQ